MVADLSATDKAIGQVATFFLAQALELLAHRSRMKLADSRPPVR